MSVSLPSDVIAVDSELSAMEAAFRPLPEKLAAAALGLANLRQQVTVWLEALKLSNSALCELCSTLTDLTALTAELGSGDGARSGSPAAEDGKKPTGSRLDTTQLKATNAALCELSSSMAEFMQTNLAAAVGGLSDGDGSAGGSGSGGTARRRSGDDRLEALSPLDRVPWHLQRLQQRVKDRDSVRVHYTHYYNKMRRLRRKTLDRLDRGKAEKSRHKNKVARNQAKLRNAAMRYFAVNHEVTEDIRSGMADANKFCSPFFVQVVDWLLGYFQSVSSALGSLGACLDESRALPRVAVEEEALDDGEAAGTGRGSPAHTAAGEETDGDRAEMQRRRRLLASSPRVIPSPLPMHHLLSAWSQPDAQTLALARRIEHLALDIPRHAVLAAARRVLLASRTRSGGASATPRFSSPLTPSSSSVSSSLSPWAAAAAAVASASASVSASAVRPGSPPTAAVPSGRAWRATSPAGEDPEEGKGLSAGDHLEEVLPSDTVVVREDSLDGDMPMFLDPAFNVAMIPADGDDTDWDSGSSDEGESAGRGSAASGAPAGGKGGGAGRGARGHRRRSREPRPMPRAGILFEELGELGSGSFGVTHLVRDSRDDGLYVLKKIRCVDVMEANDALTEALVLSKFESPYIVRFKEIFLEHDEVRATLFVCIVMEYVEGGDLEQQLQLQRRRGCHFSTATVLAWFGQLCEAVSGVHDKGMIHRDLKPANLLLTGESRLKVADFGISKVLGRSMERAHTKIGTPAYMAPEVLTRRAYDKKADVWSMGCILFELLTLAPPLFQMTTVDSVLSKIPESYGEPMRDLVRCMLKRDPTQRPDAYELLRRVRTLECARLSPADEIGLLDDVDEHVE